MNVPCLIKIKSCSEITWIANESQRNQDNFKKRLHFDAILAVKTQRSYHETTIPINDLGCCGISPWPLDALPFPLGKVADDIFSMLTTEGKIQKGSKNKKILYDKIFKQGNCYNEKTVDAKIFYKEVKSSTDNK